VSIVEAQLEEILRKYRNVKKEKSNLNPLSLKLEIESFIRKFQATDEKNGNLIAEAQDMLIDLIKIIEESRCQPFRPKQI